MDSPPNLSPPTMPGPGDQHSLDREKSHLLTVITESSDDSADPDENGKDEREKDEVQKQLEDMEKVSRQIIQEMSELEMQLEIEKTCRVNAEVFAVKVNKENKKLVRLSRALQPMWDSLPDDITKLGAEDKETPNPTCNPEYQYQLQVKDLQERITLLLEERRELSSSLETLQARFTQLTEEVARERTEKIALQKVQERQSKALKRINTVSVLVTQDYQELQQQLDLEQELRQQAETYAHQMLVRQREASRQSVILLQNVLPSEQLLTALEEVASLNRCLEQERHQHQQLVQELKHRLEGSQAESEVARLTLALSIADEQKEDVESRLAVAETKSLELETEVQTLRMKLEAADNTTHEEQQEGGVSPGFWANIPIVQTQPRNRGDSVLMPLAELLRRRKQERKEAGPENKTTTLDSLKTMAVDEMMERIKNGVSLKPTKCHTELPSPRAESPVTELKGILEGMRTKRRSWKSRLGSGHKHNELQNILLRRRRVMDVPSQQPPDDLPENNPASRCDPSPVGSTPLGGAEVKTNPWKMLQRTGAILQSKRIEQCFEGSTDTA
ncbi:shootin-1 [Callorhinchus milii]|uniref:shootin-1 n=1 Tax=Callorhinchus milii TaxID=7868 RepID=UPI001C3F851A|nr:shootin-1 [Callorhinchus milii]